MEFLIQVHIPVRNEEKRLPRLFDSIRSQTFKWCQYIFHNNNSSDSTKLLLQRFLEESPGESVIVKNYDVTLASSDYGMRIRWFDHTSPYVAMRSANDVMLPDYFSAVVDLLRSDSKIGLGYSHGYLVYEESPTVGHRDYGQVISTSVDDPFTSLKECVLRYTQPFSLWGVYRRDVFQKTSTFWIPCYGADHVLVAECSLYGSVRSTIEALDCRMIPGREGELTPLDHLRNFWTSHHLLAVRGIDQDDVLMTADIYLPFHSMLNGYLRMLSMAAIPVESRKNLFSCVIDSFTLRFSRALEFELENFLGLIKSKLSSAQPKPTSLEYLDPLWAVDVLKWLNIILTTSRLKN